MNWEVSRTEQDLIFDIAQRAFARAKQAGFIYQVQDAVMDLTATHANGCRLRLSELASAPEFDFVHDCFGIRRYLNRNTGQLEGCFLPRYMEMWEKIE